MNNKNTFTVRTSVHEALLTAVTQAPWASVRGRKYLSGIVAPGFWNGTVKLRSWNANLSYKTAQKLKREGVLV